MFIENEDKIFQAMFNNPAVGYSILTIEKEFIRVNHKFCFMLGYLEDELLGRKEQDITLPEDSDKDNAIFNELIHDGLENLTVEKRYITKEKTILYAERTLSLIMHDNGTPLFYLSIIKDISQWKKTEFDLVKAKDHLQAVIDAVPGAVSWISSDLKYLGVNRYLWEKYNRTHDDFKGKDVGFQGKSPDFVNYVDSFFKSDKAEISQEVTTGLGKTTVTNLMVAKKYNEGRAAVFIGIDISHLKRVEKALKKQMQFNKEIIQTAPVLIIILDDKLEITEFNLFASQQTGLKREDVLGKNFLDFFIPEKEKQAFKDVLKEIEQTGKLFSEYECSLKRKNNEIKLVSWHSSKLSTPEKTSSNVLLIGVDITKRKNLEEQFRQSQKMEAIGRMAGGVAHDFSNLLTVIKGYLDLAILKTNEIDPLYKTLNEINNAAKRAEDLTRQLLAFSRKQVLQLQVFKLDDVIRNIQKMIKRLIGENVNLKSYLKAEKGYIKADTGQIEQVIMNLVVNAKDAISDGGSIAIHTEMIKLTETKECLHASIPAGDYVLLSVKDNGLGIAEEMLPHIFEPFFTTKKAGKGTGLGLATVYGIITQSKGYISIETKINSGTQFHIYLPQTTGKSKTEKSESPPLIETQGAETILVVEDDDSVRGLLCEILSSYGYHVLEASKASEALLICDKYKDKIPLIITDVILPRINGKDLVDQLHKIYPEMKAVFISGYSDDDILEHGISDENFHFIQKPFTPSTILEIVRTILDF